MGLDVYFFRKPIHHKIEKCFDDIISDLLKTNNSELKSAIEDIYTYTVENHISFEEWLNENVKSTLLRFSVPSSADLGEEVAYFRKLWWIVNYFEYNLSSSSHGSVTAHTLRVAHLTVKLKTSGD